MYKSIILFCAQEKNYILYYLIILIKFKSHGTHLAPPENSVKIDLTVFLKS